jgi:hypothetical protein
MSAMLTKAALSISVDLDDDAASAAVTDGLLELFARHQIPATWAVSNPAASPLVERILSHAEGHEIALLGEASWVGPHVGRAAFDRELRCRIAAADARGPLVSTLVVGVDCLDEQHEVAIKHGITAVRHPAPRVDVKSPGRMQPGTLRFGLWGFPLRATLPGNSRLLPGGGGRRAARLLVDRAIVACGLVPLAIGAGELAARGNAARRVIDRVLAHAQRRHLQGVLDIATLRSVAAGLSMRYQSVPSRSILRPAA